MRFALPCRATPAEPVFKTKAAKQGLRTPKRVETLRGERTANLSMSYSHLFQRLPAARFADPFVIPLAAPFTVRSRSASHPIHRPIYRPAHRLVRSPPRSFAPRSQTAATVSPNSEKTPAILSPRQPHLRSVPPPLHATRWLSKATDRGFRVRCRANLSPAHGRPEWLPRPASAHRTKRRRIRTPVHDRGRFRRSLS